MNDQDRYWGQQLILLILKEQHPTPVARAELQSRFVTLVREHGSLAKAVEHMRERMRQ